MIRFYLQNPRELRKLPRQAGGVGMELLMLVFGRRTQEEEY